ncbi:MAG: carbonic anhydrase family protein [Enterococcus lacertideformus]|uniref:carbonic anhydrase n=1 Tax=Enterococcus lacertideformus TaxID=2771493 RepID=A0A931B3E9_9ENTE|nr:carbonic anhydrase family protein [Enterococcus lacertideformus]
MLDSLVNHSTEPMAYLEEMISENYSYYHYLGSLTTPPLTENVEWYVMKESVEVFSTQIKEVKQLYSHNIEKFNSCKNGQFQHTKNN